jgi:glutaminyl-tRNA synthetase
VSEEIHFSNFIRQVVEADLAEGRHDTIVTRFPPEPNGYLHIGHAKSICLNFGIARDYKGRCHLRFDDTNPLKEDVEYIESIKEDVRWLGFDWGAHLYHAADYFGRLYEWAEKLIRNGRAFVCDLSGDEIRLSRGTLTRPGTESPHRNRSVEENLDLFRRMRAGEFPNGARVLRAKIDMASPNLNLRDPVMYRIIDTSHHRTGDAWKIYPTYDWAHGQSDAIEGITHSLCTLEFEDHRPLYDWYLDQIEPPRRPRQIEFARLNLGFTVLSKRVLNELVSGKLVEGWDDPRMPTLAGLRRRGYTPEAIRVFCDRIRVAKADSLVDMELLENTLREDLDARVPRAMCVHRPLRVVLTNVAEGTVEELEAPNFPDDPSRMGSRRIPFSRVLYVERDDFMEDPPKKFHRLAPGREVRLRFACVIRCDDVVRDPATGEIVELRCTCDRETLNGPPVGRKVPGTIHWVSAEHCVPVTLRLYDRLFTVPNPMSGDGDYRARLNPASLEVLDGARAERSVASIGPGERVQFERRGFYVADGKDSRPDRPVFNRIVSLRDTWAKIAGAGKP